MFTKDEVQSLNSTIDTFRDRKCGRDDILLKNAAAPVSDAAAARDGVSADRNVASQTPYAAPKSRQDLGGCLSWSEKDEHSGFRKVLAHPKLVPYIHTLCGSGYRMDHQPIIILQEKNSEGFSLHGGPMESTNDSQLDRPSFELQYKWHNGHIYNSLLAVSIVLSPVRYGDGGFCVVKGSHKCNYALPKHFASGESAAFNESSVSSVGCEAGEESKGLQPGDVILFSEATIHGALPWRGEHERRIALYRFSPANVAYARSYLGEKPASSFTPSLAHNESLQNTPFGIPQHILDSMSSEERAVIEPPFANRAERIRVEVDDGYTETDCSLRNSVKKTHDRQCFDTEYF